MSHLGALVALAFLFASALINYEYGYILGGYVYALVGVAAVLSNATCPFFAHAAHQHKRWPTFYAALFFWALTLTYSALNAAGYAAHQRLLATNPKQADHRILENETKTLTELEAATRKNLPAIQRQREKVNALLRKHPEDPDPQSTLFRDLFGVPDASFRFLVAALFSLVVEVGAALGLFLALSQPKKNSRKKPERANGKVKLWQPKQRGLTDAR
jgi:hypothetical protein